ncbi:UNVERIFIED_CONTAM: hypothetical protein GTU68_009168 [Idotea baltica]|nr:hypothetical protein [Idotea baltica]
MQSQSYKSTCSYCGVGCGIEVKKDRRGRIKIEGDQDHPTNRGLLCSKGRNLHYVVEDHSDRLLYPKMRGSREQPLERVSWDRAMDRAASVFKSLIVKYGPDSVGFYVSGQCLTEEYYLANKLAKGFIGTNNIDTNSRLCMSSAVTAYTKTLGEDAVPTSYEDIDLADTFMIAGANPAWCHPIIFKRLEKRKAEHPETKIIVVDPRVTDSCSIADLHLQIRPGTDVVLYNAIARRILETGNADSGFIEEHTESFHNYRLQVLKRSVKAAAKICGVSVDDIKRAAEYISKSGGFISMWAMGLNQSRSGVDKNFALINLSLMTGQIGKPGAGPFSLTGQPNAMGGREVGGMASMLAAHRLLSNDQHRSEVAAFWGVEHINKEPGYTATEMFDALEDGRMKAIWIVCTNPAVSLPNSRRIERALAKARFVIVQDISDRSESVAHADLVLPAAGWLEKEGTMTGSDRTINYLPKVVQAPGEALADAEILMRFARKMGFHGFDFSSISDVYDEHCRLTKHTHIDVSGLSHQRLKHEGPFQWPVPFQDHPGTKRLFSDFQFYTNTGKARFNTPAADHDLSERIGGDFPLILTTGRLRDQWHTMTRTGKVNKLMMHQSTPLLEMHPIDARIRGLRNGELALVKNERGDVRLKVSVTDKIRQGVVFLPMHWGKKLESDYGRANNLTGDGIDPMSKQPNFKLTGVEVYKYVQRPQKIIIVGAGAAAFSFIKSYRARNDRDQLVVFSKEQYPFYNRILLPEYISEHLAWDQLMKIGDKELRSLNIDVQPANSIVEIDRDKKKVRDEKGVTHYYDTLILATGSRAFTPRDVPLHLPGVFTMRNRHDADALKGYLDQISSPRSDQHVVIVGGGLLGLEIAASLMHMKIRTTIIQRAGSLMQRQLDPLASNLLAEEVRDRGVQIYFDNEVDTVFDHHSNMKLTVTLKSGKTIYCSAVLYAIGVVPNIELAKSADLPCGKGVVVNGFLQTRDPSIYAIGEIAEFRHQVFGITSAAEQQSEILAKYLSGDLSANYDGSISMNILKFDGLDVCSIGQVQVPKDDPSYEEIILMDISQRFYKKCVVRQDQLIGAILMGDKSEFAEFRILIEKKIELSEKRTELLRNGGNSKPLEGRLVCSCSNVGEGNLIGMIREGCSDFDQLCQQSGAGMGCGSCKSEVKSILQNQMELVV